MFSEKEDSSEFRIPPSKQDVNGAFLIDRSPMYFEPLLNYLRHGQLIMDKNVCSAGELFNNISAFYLIPPYKSHLLILD